MPWASGLLRAGGGGSWGGAFGLVLTVIVAMGSAASGAAGARSNWLGLMAFTLPGPDQTGVPVCSTPWLPRS